MGGWSIASWNCCVLGNVSHSPLVAVYPGDVVYGQIIGSNCSTANGVCGAWQIGAYANGRGSTGYTTVATSAVVCPSGGYGGSPGPCTLGPSTDAMTRYDGGVLEAYYLNKCSQLPPSRSITFSNVSVAQVGNGWWNASWYNDVRAMTPDCAFGVSSTPGTSSSATITWDNCRGLDLASDPDNCGSCGHACPVGTASTSCVSGVCHKCDYDYYAPGYGGSVQTRCM